MNYSPEDLRRLDVLARRIAAAAERSTNPQALPQDRLDAEADHDTVTDLRKRVRDFESVGYLSVDWRTSWQSMSCISFRNSRSST